MDVKYGGFSMASAYTRYVMGKLVWRLEVLFLWLGDKPGEEVGSVMPLMLQVYFRDNSGSLHIPHMDIQSEIKNWHSDFFIRSTFRICSSIGNISITLPSCQLINNREHTEGR